MSYLEDLREKSISSILDWIRRRSFSTRLFITTCAGLGLVFLARVGVFGDPLFRISKLIVPQHIEMIDGRQFLPRLSFQFDISTKTGRKKGLIGHSYYSGDIVHLLVNVDQPVFIVVLGVDGKSVNVLYPLTSKNRPVLLDETSGPYELGSYALDDNIGKEIFIAIVSKRRFDTNKEIIPLVEKQMLSQSASSNPKGVMHDNIIELPSDIIAKYVSFMHLADI